MAMELISLENDVVLTRLDKQRINVTQDEILAFACVRNESLRLPYFIRYHRRLGVDRFFVVDNNSDDGTVNYLLAQKDVHLFHTDGSYADSRCGVDWLNLLLRTYGVGHWCLTLDADELFVYPLCEDVDLHQLSGYLETTKAQAVVTFMLDMYSDRSIRTTLCELGQSFVEVCRYFDVDTYHQRDENQMPVRGGARHRLFWHGRERAKPSPMLKKIPFAKWRDDLRYEASTHLLAHARVAQLTGVLQHFKFFSDFYEQAKTEVERKEHWDNAAQYESYWAVLGENPDMTASHSGSVEYVDSKQLMDLGLMRAPPEYLDNFPGEGS